MLQLNIIKAARVKVRVDGLVTDEHDAELPCSFSVDCRRLDMDGLMELVQASRSYPASDAIVQKLMAVIEGWQGVADEDGKPLAYTPENVAELLRVPGMAAQVMLAYFDQVQAKAKN